MSLKAKLNAKARERGVASDPIRKQFAFALLYRRFFSVDGDQWMVLGGNALLLRTGGGRFTKDVDMARADGWAGGDELLVELRDIVGRDVGDGFTLEVDRVEPHDHRDQYGYGTKSAKAYLRVVLAGDDFEAFTIDLSTRRHVNGPVEYIVPEPIIDHESIRGLPAVPVVPIENHFADKVCAMYEIHREGQPSTRYRDLADLVRIVQDVQDVQVDAGRLSETLAHEQQRRRMKPLPTALQSPHPTWETEFPKAAQDFAEFPPELYSLDASLRTGGVCLNEVLSGQRTTGIWSPLDQSWEERPTA